MRPDWPRKTCKFLLPPGRWSQNLAQHQAAPPPVRMCSRSQRQALGSSLEPPRAPCRCRQPCTLELMRFRPGGTELRGESLKMLRSLRLAILRSAAAFHMAASAIDLSLPRSSLEHLAEMSQLHTHTPWSRRSRPCERRPETPPSR